jgi:hypothetical protein
MSLATYASPYNNDDNYISNDKKPKNRSKTIKRREPLTNRINNNPKIEAMMKTIHNIDNGNDEDDNLENFNPLDPPEISNYSQQQSMHQPQQSQTEISEENIQEQFTQLPGEYAKQYYQQYVPYINQMSNDNSPSGAPKDELLNKLNYIIHMLEEQRGESTNHVTEEIILYSFLGVFIIFVVDSFARVGKYVR